MRHFLALALAMTFVSRAVFAGEGTSHALSLHPRVVREGETTIELCEDGECKGLVPDSQGLTSEEWDEVRGYCANYQYFGASQVKSAKLIAAGLMAAVASWPIAVIGSIVLIAVKNPPVEAVEATEVVLMSRGVESSDEAQYPMSAEVLLSLSHSIQKCVLGWQQYKRNQEFYENLYQQCQLGGCG